MTHSAAFSLTNTLARIVALPVLLICSVIGILPPASGAELVACRQFTSIAPAPPIPRDAQRWRERFGAIKSALGSQLDRVLFLGDSITERWPADIWQRDFAPLGALDAGIDGDRTEHLLWRLDHGELKGPPPEIVVLLIGTNDLGHGRSVEVTAEGIRADLARVRELVPSAHILLLGLTPRSDRFGRAAADVNRLIRTCDGGPVTYLDLGRKLRDRQGRIPQGILLDGVHFTAAGYEVLAGELLPQIERLLPRR